MAEAHLTNHLCSLRTNENAMDFVSTNIAVEKATQTVAQDVDGDRRTSFLERLSSCLENQLMLLL